MWVAIGDVLYTLGVYLVFALFKRDVLWMRHVSKADVLMLTLAGFLLAVGIEWKGFLFERWAYLPSMPIIPFFEVGLSPVLQMTILLPLSVYVTGFLYRTLKNRLVL